MAKPYWQRAGKVRLYHGNCLSTLCRISQTPRLVFADPPYNQGIAYGTGVTDRLSKHEYLEFTRNWLAAVYDVLAPDGSLWVLISDDWAGYISVYLEEMGMHRRNWIKWYETFGVNCRRKFNRCSRHLLYYVRDKRRFVFNRRAVTRPSDRQTKYRDKRANPCGKLWDDVWLIPRLAGTHGERVDGAPTQLPLELVMPVVGCATEPGDLVLDPFIGSGTTAVAAARLGRRCIGIDASKQALRVAAHRLANVM